MNYLGIDAVSAPPRIFRGDRNGLRETLVAPPEVKSSEWFPACLEQFRASAGLQRDAGRVEVIYLLNSPGSLTGERIGQATARALSRVWGAEIRVRDYLAAMANLIRLDEPEPKNFLVVKQGTHRRIYTRAFCAETGVVKGQTELSWLNFGEWTQLLTATQGSVLYLENDLDGEFLESMETKSKARPITYEELFANLDG